MDKEKVVRKEKAVRKVKEGAFVDMLNQEMKELQDSQKQIEEMAKDLDRCPYIQAGCGGDKHEGNVKIAEFLINAGYRKIPEGGVVLTREEHQKYLAFKIIEPQVRGCLDRERELEKRLETAIKETAEKFAERLKEKCKMDDNPLGLNVFLINGTIIDEICKEIIGEEK